MRKTLTTIFFILLANLCLFATTQLDQSEYSVTTYIPHYCLVTITTNSTAMPFDVTSSGPAYSSSGTGLNIGTWSIESNMSPSTVVISATDLTCATDGYTLPYTLTLYYSYVDADLVTHEGTWSVASGDSTTITITNTRPVVSLDQSIYFMFTDDVDTSLASSGNYTATLTVTLSGE